MSELTPSQTIGPFFREALRWAADETPRDFGVPVVRVTGVVLDGQGDPVPDAVLEIWQPSLARRAYPGQRLPGFQRADTVEGGRFAFFVERPATQAVWANVTVFTRGLLRELFTRVYIGPEDDPARIALPPGVPQSRAHTLVARRSAVHAGTFEWDVRLRGEGETVFFSI
jgi:protocatechuate 3,4-dioxygenase alpha subunit